MDAFTDHALSAVVAPPRLRSDGWTAERQEAFAEALAVSGSVRAACSHVGMSTVSAYRLRAHPGAAPFADAWNLAIGSAHARLMDLAMERAREGIAMPIVSEGAVIGEYRAHSDRMLMFLLTRHDAERARRDPAPAARGNVHDDFTRALATLEAGFARADGDG